MIQLRLLFLLCFISTSSFCQDLQKAFDRLYASADSVKHWSYYNLSWTYHTINVDSSLLYADSGRMHSLQLGDDEWAIRSHYFTGVALKSASRYEEARYHFNELLVYFGSTADTAGMANNLFQIGVTYSQQGDDVKAIETFNRSLTLFDAIGDKRSVALNLNSKGIVLKNADRHAAASEQYLEALLIYEELKDSSGMADVLNNLGNLVALKGQYNLALRYYARQEEINLAQNNSWGMAFVHENKARVYLEQGKYTKARQSLTKALKIRRRLIGKVELVGALTKLTDLAIHTRNWSQARQYNKETLSLTQDIGSRRYYVQALRQQGLIAEGEGRLAEAIQSMKRYKIQSDSLKSEEVQNELSKLEAVFQNKQKEGEINRLQLEDRIQTLQLTRQKWGLITLALVLCFLTLLLWRIYQQKRQIIVQKDTIDEALREKETLLQEIHHRVKNNLQVISSLLRIQTNQTTDEGALAALREGQSRVNSMSLIHQDLYQHDNLKGIYMPDYIKKLTFNLLDTYQVSDQRIELTNNIDNLILDVDTVVPLGLIINELVTNAIKYAFPDDRIGTIDVSLTRHEGHLLLAVTDNGVGMTDTPSDKDAFGLGLIEAFANKLDADVVISNHNGMRVSLEIKNFSS